MAKYSKITEESTPEVTSRSINIFLVILLSSVCVNITRQLKPVESPTDRKSIEAHTNLFFDDAHFRAAMAVLWSGFSNA